jgi:hypothetical protein
VVTSLSKDHTVRAPNEIQFAWNKHGSELLRTLEMKKQLAQVLAFLLVCAAASRAQDTLVTTAPTGTDSIDWTQFNADPNDGLIDVSLSGTFSFTTTDSVAGTGTWGAGGLGAGLVVTEGNGWFGNFQNGATLNYDEYSGPLTLSFTGPGYTQVGVQIQPDSYGDFTAQICDNTDSVCFIEDGTSTNAEQNTAIYIGLSNTSPISSVTFSLTSVSGDNPNVSDFAVSDVTLGEQPIVNVPEGGASLLYLLLAGASLCGAVFLRRRSGFIVSEAA